MVCRTPRQGDRQLRGQSDGKTQISGAGVRQNYMADLICQRLTGMQESKPGTPEMRRGTDLEPHARARYIIETGEIVTETGLVDHPTIAGFGASPDGLVGDSGLIEIKCPNTWTHLETIKTGRPKREYLLQMQTQMACTGRLWCDFVSYDDLAAGRHAVFLHPHRARRRADCRDRSEVSAFLQELEAEIEYLKRKAA